MLQLIIPDIELFNDETSEFETNKGQTIQLEHSLVSISKWESKINKPFISSNDKTVYETIEYIRCMTVTQNVNKLVYDNLTDNNVKQVTEYITLPMTATTFNEHNNHVSREVITSELIYCWMILYNIPIECQRWHLNRLLTLIRVCANKNEPQKKMGKREIMERNRDLNAARRQKLSSDG